jgi:hypothetical protein
MPRRNRTMKGGMFESIAVGLTDAWNSTKKATSDAYNSVTGAPLSQPSYVASATTAPTTAATGYFGGRKGKRTRRMRGGYTDNTPLTGLAASAAPISGVASAKPHTIVGGKRSAKRRRHRHSKSCRKCK